MAHPAPPEHLGTAQPTGVMPTVSSGSSSIGWAPVAATVQDLSLPSPIVTGRAFFHPLVDFLFLCGGFSVPLLFLGQAEATTIGIDHSSMLWIFIFFNYAHFASSSLRLYLMPHGRRRHPFLAFGLPVVAALAVLTAVALPDVIGRMLIALYLTWSPYHYARQAYGLSLMYGYRSGVSCSGQEKRWLLLICLLPFLRAVINPDDTSVTDVMGVRSLWSLLPDGALTAGLVEGLSVVVTVLTPLIFVLPVVFAFYKKTRLTLFGLALVLINGLWLVAFSLFEGAVWATVAHSVQYLLIVSYMQAHDTVRSSGGRHRPAAHMLAFYVLSILVGVPIFLGLPLLVEGVGGWLGQGWSTAHCVTMTVVAINLHHFIVDGCIWRATPKAGRPARRSSSRPLESLVE